MALPTGAGAIPRLVSRATKRARQLPSSRVFMPHFRHIYAGVASTAKARLVTNNRTVSTLVNEGLLRGRFFSDVRGLYRVFNSAEYRFYRSNVSPPLETDTPFATSATIPFEPSDLYADGTWFLSVSYFNGVIDSGFLQIGANGESFLQLDISGGVIVVSPPQPPTDTAINGSPGGVANIQAFYNETGPSRAEQFAMKWTVDGSDPPLMTPSIGPSAVQSIPSSGLAILAFGGGGLSHGTVLKVRIQMRRVAGGNVYSSSSPILTFVSDTVGPTAPVSTETWPGRVPENF